MGRMLESAIGAHLLNHSLTEGFSVHYWRQGDQEIDFVIQKRGQVLGIEVKIGVIQRAMGMAAFQKEFSPNKIMLIGDSGLSCEEFLQINPNSLF
jgi:predicted AAA+ superfamily ATPase